MEPHEDEESAAAQEEAEALSPEEVARIEEEMMDIVVEMGHTNLTLQQFTDMIRCLQS